MVSVGYFATLTGSFGAVKSSGDALEAQRVAEIESNKIRLTDYENLDSKVQQGKWVDAPDNPGWQYFVTLGSEKVIDGDNKQRIAEVKVRRKGDEESRFSTVVPVSSGSSGGNGFKCKDEGNLNWKWFKHGPHRASYYSVKIPKAGFLIADLAAVFEREHGGDSPSGTISVNGKLFESGYNGETITVPVSKGDFVIKYRATRVVYISCQ